MTHPGSAAPGHLRRPQFVPRTRQKLLLRHELSTVANGWPASPIPGGVAKAGSRAERGAPRDFVECPGTFL